MGIGFPIKSKPNTIYTLSAEFDTTRLFLSATYYDKFGNNLYVDQLSNSNSFTFTTPIDCEFIVIAVSLCSAADINSPATFSNIQLELGSTATTYEKYIQPQTAITNADGIAEGLTSLSPNMSLITDTNGVVINCEYYRDIDAYIDNLTSAVALTGGV
jgi:hypothetical protein